MRYKLVRTKKFYKAKRNGIFGSEELFNIISSDDFYNLLNKTVRSVNEIGTPDPILTKLIEEKGFNALPVLVDNTHYELLLKSKLAEIFRGVRKDDAKKDFAFNPSLFIGKGIYCNGVYFMYGGDDAKQKAEKYISIPKDIQVKQLQEHLKTYNHGEVISALISNDAKIVDIRDLIKLKNNLKVEAMQTMSGEIKKKFIDLISKDISVVAVLKGFDAIKIPHTKYMVVLNRGKLILKNPEIVK